MRKWTTTLLMVMCSLPAMAGDKQSGKTTLKNFEPAGTTDKKQHKHQQFDFTFEASGTQYTCRSSEGTKLKAVDWPVGDNISYEINKDKGKVKNSKGKQVDCTMMRVQAVQPEAPPSN